MIKLYREGDFIKMKIIMSSKLERLRKKSHQLDVTLMESTDYISVVSGYRPDLRRNIIYLMGTDRTRDGDIASYPYDEELYNKLVSTLSQFESKFR